MSPPGRPKGEDRSAQREGAPDSSERKQGRAVEAVEHVLSPCVSLCVLDADGNVCLGCFRTLDEIAAWSLLDADAKRGVLAALPERRSAQRPR